jgi:hypothetical protein
VVVEYEEKYRGGKLAHNLGNSWISSGLYRWNSDMAWDFEMVICKPSSLNNIYQIHKSCG